MPRLAIRCLILPAYLAALAALASLALSCVGAPWPGPLDAGQSLRPGALLVDAWLVALVAVQRQAMARPAFREAFDVPPAGQGAVYALMTCLTLATLVVAWQPLPDLVWQVDGPAARSALAMAQGAGWALVLAAALGLTPGQHPTRLPGALTPAMGAGLLLALWSAPDATEGRLVLAGGASLWMAAEAVSAAAPFRGRAMDETRRIANAS